MAALVPARLELRDGTPWSAPFGDVYHSAGGGLAQAHHVFLHGNDLPRRWAGRRRFTILETGFGLGLNFLATWCAWRADRGRCERLHYVAIEKHPFALADLRELHRLFPELAEEANQLHAQWPPLVSGAHRLEFGGMVLTLFFADIAVLRDLRLVADALYLDGFAPAKNPEMWSHAVMRSLSRLAASDATLATWSVAASVRDALAETGFEVEKRPGFGDKREMLVGRNARSVPDPDLPERKAVVVGAGLAGAAVCERLCARGWEVELHERRAGPAQEASGNHAGTFHPIVTPDDSIFARLTRSAFLYSLGNWRALREVRHDQCGVLQLARNDKEMEAQRKAVSGLPQDYAQLVSREEAAQHAGVPVTAPGLWFPQSGWIKPRSLVRAQLAACGNKLRTSYGSPMEQLPEGRTVILANSAQAPKLCPVPSLRLRRVRGQLTYVPEGALEPPHAVLLRGGMVLPPIDGVCVVGASYDIEDEDQALRDDSHEGNLERLQGIMGVRLSTRDLAGRVAFRSVAPDRLPVVGRIKDNVYGAFAYGSRGLLWAALAAEIIASQLEGEPAPIEGKLLDALAPGRFARRAESRGSRPSRRASR
jgi:tRNA 5-methylaminomethyl-2-thiouridine biosynthesis bifunctional protein